MSIYLLWNLGLGDAIICNGLVRRLIAHRNKRVAVAALNTNYESVKFMFRDNPMIEVNPVASKDEQEEEAAWYKETVTIGARCNGWDDRKSKFDREFYNQLGMDFNTRWDWFYAPRATSLELVPEEGVAFVHDDPKRGWVIPALPMASFRPSLTGRIFDYWQIIEKAPEVHCIDSAFACWVDSMPENGQKLYYHKLKPIEDNRNSLTRRRNWIEV